MKSWEVGKYVNQLSLDLFSAFHSFDAASFCTSCQDASVAFVDDRFIGHIEQCSSFTNNGR